MINANNNMAYFILDYARGNWGKTSALKRVIQVLTQRFGNPISVQTSGPDEWALFNNVVTVSGIQRVVVSTVGDPGSVQPRWLQDAVNANADIIVCAARDYGSTIVNVKNILGGAGYKGIWFRNFYSYKFAHLNTMNDITANAIVQLIQNL